MSGGRPRTTNPSRPPTPTDSPHPPIPTPREGSKAHLSPNYEPSKELRSFLTGRDPSPIAEIPRLPPVGAIRGVCFRCRLCLTWGVGLVGLADGGAALIEAGG